MFDTMTLTKIVGGVCGALLVFLMGNWAAESLYSMGGGHGDDHHQAYVIDTGGDDHGAEAAEEGPSLAELWAAADIEKGAKVFGKCKACHKLEDGANATGPYLYGVVGRDVASAAGFDTYSGNLKPVADVWTPETLDGFLESPKGYAPGTSMGFSGLKKPADRINVIAYLDQLDGDMYEMAAPAMAEEASADGHAEAETEMAATEESMTEEATAEAEPAQEAEAMAEETMESEETEIAAAEETATEEAMTQESAMEEEAAADTEAMDAGLAAMVAEADLAKGEKVYKKCKACHALEDGKNRVGPHLFNLNERDIASVEGFKYSEALTAIDGNWTVDQLDAFLTKPKDFVPGTKMSFSGLRKEEDRAAVIAYILSTAQ